MDMIGEQPLYLSLQLKKWSESQPEKPFIYYQDQVITYLQAERITNGLAERLYGSGIRKEDIVCLILPRIPELILAFLSVVKLGGIPAPVNHFYSKEAMAQFLHQVRPATCILHDSFISLLPEDQVDDFQCRPVVVEQQSEGVAWQEASCEAAMVSKGALSQPDADEIAYLNFTGGSTGLPKGALATYGNIYWNTRTSIETFGFRSDDVHLCMFSPFSHPHELFARPLQTGASLVLLESVNPKTIVSTIRKHAVSCMMGLAPMYEMMLNHCATKRISTLRIAESGGMYTRPDLAACFLETFGVPILSVWGSTETTGIAIANRLDNYRIDGSMGTVCPLVEVKIKNEDGLECAPGEIGELYFKGRSVVAGYLAGVAYCCEGGWYRSGDMASKDQDGFYYFADRKSGMVKIAGLKVYPLQVELVIQNHPDIKEAAVVGVEERRRGAALKAVIVCREGVVLGRDDIAMYCKGKLMPYMIPKRIEVVSELPKTGSGKVDRKRLAEG